MNRLSYIRYLSSSLAACETEAGREIYAKAIAREIGEIEAGR